MFRKERRTDEETASTLAAAASNSCRRVLSRVSSQHKELLRRASDGITASRRHDKPHNRGVSESVTPRLSRLRKLLALGSRSDRGRLRLRNNRTTTDDELASGAERSIARLVGYVWSAPARRSLPPGPCLLPADHAQAPRE